MVSRVLCNMRIWTLLWCFSAEAGVGKGVPNCQHCRSKQRALPV